MAITRVGAAVGNTQTVTIPTHAAGDLIVIFAYRDGSNTAPSLPSGWTNLTNGGGSTNSMRVGYRIATDSSTVSGTWTSATTCYCVVYRSDGTIGVGAAANTGANSATVSYPALTLTADPDEADHSWIIGCYGHRNAGTDGTVAPTGMTNVIADDTGITDSGGLHDTNGAVSSWTAQTVTVSASSGWRAATVEITEIPPAAPPPGGGDITFTGPATVSTESAATLNLTVDTGDAEAGRIVLIALTGDGIQSCTGATIGGETGTVIVSQPGAGDASVSAHIVAAVVPSGSGNQSVSITFAGTLFSIVSHAYVIRGAAWPAFDSGGAVDDSFAFQANVSVDTPSNGAAFGAMFLGFDTTPAVTLGAGTMTSARTANFYGSGYGVSADLNDLPAATGAVFQQDTNFVTIAAIAVFEAAEAGGPDPVTGTLAAQESGSDTAAATGAVGVAGSGAAQETGSDTMSAAGSPVVAGSAAAQEAGSDTFAGSGTVAAPGVTGTMAAQETGDDVLSASGSVAVTGSAVAQEAGSDTAAISGAATVAGSAAAQEVGLDIATITGSPAVSGSAAAQEVGSDTLAAAGGPAVAGAGAAQEVGADTMVASGTAAVSGALTAQESGSDAMAGSGAVAIAGSMAAQETGSDSMAAVGTVAEAGAVAGGMAVRESGADTLIASGVVLVAGAVVAQEAGDDVAAGAGAVGAVTGAMAAQEAGGDSFSASGTNGDVAPPVEWQGRAGLSQRRDEDEQIIAEEDEILLALIAEFLEQKYAVA